MARLSCTGNFEQVHALMLLTKQRKMQKKRPEKVQLVMTTYETAKRRDLRKLKEIARVGGSEGKTKSRSSHVCECKSR